MKEVPPEIFLIVDNEPDDVRANSPPRRRPLVRWLSLVGDNITDSDSVSTNVGLETLENAGQPRFDIEGSISDAREMTARFLQLRDDHERRLSGNVKSSSDGT